MSMHIFNNVRIILPKKFQLEKWYSNLIGALNFFFNFFYLQCLKTGLKLKTMETSKDIRGK